MKHSINTSNLNTTHGPLTPPEDAASPTIQTDKPRKTSVTFDPAILNKNHDILSPTATEPPVAIDLNAHAVPSSILVALWDRDKEMRDLVKHNHVFFDSLRMHMPNWTRFENTLYYPRGQLSDEIWMSRIEKALEGFPHALDRFKDLVGYIGEPSDQPEESVHVPQFDHVDLVNIRDFPGRLKKFPEAYPQFFINCQRTLEANGPKDFVRFKETLFSPRSQMTDEMWEASLNDQLAIAPNLMTQLKEIIAYEAEEEDEEERRGESESEEDA
ncbi:hypothetical protein CLU79DRAFT_246305 [Phycomyces nitens]|nr:hypothetical protein CLU79DRAFT_246305 [Phycomyces nitens]